MHTEQDVSRIVRSWLRVDEHESADQVLAIVLDSLDATPQRRQWWPARRIPEMNSYAKLAIAAVAVVAVAIVGFNLLPAGSDPEVGGPAVTVSPTAVADTEPFSRGRTPGQREPLDGTPLRRDGRRASRCRSQSRQPAGAAISWGTRRDRNISHRQATPGSSSQGTSPPSPRTPARVRRHGSRVTRSTTWRRR